MDYGLPVDLDAKRAASFAAESRSVVLAEVGFGEVQPQFVYSRSQRDVIAEIALPAGSIEPRFARSEDGVGWQVDHGSAGIKAVALPSSAESVDERALIESGQYADRIGTG